MSNDFSMFAGDDRTLKVAVTNQQGAVVNLTGASIAWKAADRPFGVPTLEKAGVIIDGPAGRFDVALAPVDTALLLGALFHWAIITEVGGQKSTIYLGMISISPASDLVTVEMVKARFPEMGNVPDSVIQLVISEALPQVGESWIERDRQPAMLYLVAHMLAMQGYPASASGAAGSGATTGPMKRHKVGDVEVEFAGVATGGGISGSNGFFNATAYGQQFALYMRRNFPAVAVV